MKLELHQIGNTQPGFLRIRNNVMRTTKADLVAIFNTDIKVWGFTQAIDLFKDLKVFAVTFPYKKQKGAESIRPADFANGGSSIYRVKIWRKLRGIDLAFEPAWWDDVDLSWRAKKAGYKILEDNRAFVHQVVLLQGTQLLKLNPYHWFIEKRNYCLLHYKHNPDYFLRLEKNPFWRVFCKSAERRYQKYHV